MRQFKNHEEIAEALKEIGTRYYTLYGGESELREQMVVGHNIHWFGSRPSLEIIYVTTFKDGELHKSSEFIADMQNWSSKATFTDKKMAEAWREAHPRLMDGRDFRGDW